MEQWVDDEFIQSLPPVIMHAVAKRILKRNGRTDAHAWVHENLDYFERELGERVEAMKKSTAEA